MKFEQLYSEQTIFDDCIELTILENLSTRIIKIPELGLCLVCGDFTRWKDVRSAESICSVNCLNSFWTLCQKKLKEHTEVENSQKEKTRSGSKDILIVVHNQLDYLKICIQSLMRNTEDCVVRIWNNASDKDTFKYLLSLEQFNTNSFRFEITHHYKNIGFILPNNIMASQCENDYIILLNSDCKVFKGWDKLIMGHLESGYDQVGYLGGLLDAECKGVRSGTYGEDIDYVSGFCFGIRRNTYEKFGLFDDKNLSFAYGEDSDFSLRLKESNGKIIALNSPCVFHFGNKTVNRVHKEGEIDLANSFQTNHEYLRERWKEYLSHHRILRKNLYEHI